MISCACVRIVIGSAGRPFCALMSGVRLEVAHVSKTAVSGRNSVQPQAHAPVYGASIGLTGSCSGAAKTGRPHDLQYQTGNGTPKYRWREMHQSHLRFSTHAV